MRAAFATPDGMGTIRTIWALFELLLFAAPAVQIRAAGALVGLGQILEIAKASDALELPATGSGLDTTADNLRRRFSQ